MTLQQHFNLIKEGKGNKAQFLRQARQLFPQYFNQYSDFNTTVNVLKSKQIINEAVGGVVSKGFDIFDWKNILAEEAKAEEKKVTKEVEDYRKNAYDNTDMKNADNINFNEIMKGFYAELRDEKNSGKTGDEIKEMVVKNLAKDPLYYTKDGEFGVKGVGYTTEAPGLGEPKEPKGKHKSSGYGDLDTDIKVEKVKANVQDSLGDREAKTSMPSKVKEMTTTPQNSAGVKKMKMSGVEKTIKLQENVDSEIDEVYQMPSVGQLSGGGGKRFIPKQITFPSQIRKKFGDHILFNPANNQLYISQILFNNLIKGGANQPDIKRMIMDIPMMVKQILNKSENYGPTVNFPNKEFKVYLPLNAVVEKATEDKFNKDGTKQYWAKDDLLIPNLNVQEDLEEASTTNEFEKGDKVKDSSGKTGTIVDKTMNPGGMLFYKVKLDGGKEENIRATELEKVTESKLRSIIKQIIREELNKGSIEINGKTVKTYTQNGDKSYNVTYDDGTKDIIYVNNDGWDEINTLHQNATKN